MQKETSIQTNKNLETMIKFAVHHTFDCMDYNEHYYFETFEEALESFNAIRQEIIDEDDIEETYTDEEGQFYIQESDGCVKVYIQEI